MKKFYIVLAILIVALGGYFVYQATQKPTEKEVVTQGIQKGGIVYTGEVFTFASDDKQFTVQYNEDGSWARVSLDGAQYELMSVVSASGARYANQDESVVFWEHQREAILEINGETIFEGAKLVENNDFTMTSTGFSLEGTKWQWQGTEYEDGEIVEPNMPEEFILYFMEEGRFSSKTDCNTVMGTFDIKGDNLSFGQMASTKMACPDEQTQEELYTAMLIDAKTIEVNDAEDRLDIGIDGEAQGVMTFIRFFE